MESPEIISQVYQNLQQDPENLYCFDCGSPNADHASTNHGIFLCAQCAGNHLIFGPSVSNIKSWVSEPWTLKQLKLMSAGGNSAFQQFLLNYNITRETPIFALKYKTNAAEYYRCMLNALSESLSYDVDFPPVEIGIQLINENVNSSRNDLSAPMQYSDIPIQLPLAENIANVQVPSIENEEQKKGWKSWIKAKYAKSIQFGDKVVDKFNNFVSTNPTMKKLDEHGTKAANRISEEATKFSQHPHVQYAENLVKKTSDQIVEGATSSYNYFSSNPTLQKVRDGANNFFVGIEKGTKKASSAAMNYIKNKRNQGHKDDREVQQYLLQNENPSN